MITNALSVDVEEYYHAMIFQEGTKGFVGRYFVSRIEESVDCVLALLGRRDIRATFFILGEVAAAHPTVIRKIAVQGHEIASHGNRHELVRNDRFPGRNPNVVGALGNSRSSQFTQG